MFALHSLSHLLFSVSVDVYLFAHYNVTRRAVSLPGLPPGHTPGAPPTWSKGVYQGAQAPQFLPREPRGACYLHNAHFSPCSKLSAYYALGLTNDTVADALDNCVLVMLNEPTKD